MTETDEPQFTTLAERIAALNKQKNFTAPPPASARRAPPPPPAAARPAPRRAPSPSPSPTPSAPAALASQRSPNLPPRPATSHAGKPPLPRRPTRDAAEASPPPALPGRRGLAPPPLPTRRSTDQGGASSPALPPRQPSSQSLAVCPSRSSARRNSNSSEASHVSTVSNLSLNYNASSTTSRSSVDGQPARKLPPAFDQAKLPPLPPTKREREAQAKEKAAQKAAAAATVPVKAPLLPSKSAPVIPRLESARPSLPPRLPTRPARAPVAAAAAAAEEEAERRPALPRRVPPPASSPVRPVPQVDGEKAKGTPADVAPPPVPLASRPTFAEVETVSTRAAHAATAGGCLVCRDFSAPDAVAAQHPSAGLPRQDPIGHLAQVLCGPFASPTDKARAIFTWCHHNIAYDVEGFFGGCIARGTPGETVFAGKAVCEGYARVYEAIAARAGLECVVVGGHGKGYGFAPPPAGRPPPRRDASGHAWNAVRIDGGEWKLVDACWGAGAVGDRRYTKRFAPEMFTLSNELFGLKHFPEDARYFLRADGRAPTWEEYIVGPVRGEPATWFSNAGEEGLSEFTFAPQQKHIPVGEAEEDEVVRFQFGKVCEHWSSERHGKGAPMLLMLEVQGPGGGKKDLVPLDHDGFWWWLDVPARELGVPGQRVSVLGLETLDGRSARGVGKDEFLRKKGRVGMSWVGIAAWELV